jgi:hypothetical protein
MPQNGLKGFNLLAALRLTCKNTQNCHKPVGSDPFGLVSAFQGRPKICIDRALQGVKRQFQVLRFLPRINLHFNQFSLCDVSFNATNKIPTDRNKIKTEINKIVTLAGEALASQLNESVTNIIETLRDRKYEDKGDLIQIKLE